MFFNKKKRFWKQYRIWRAEYRLKVQELYKNCPNGTPEKQIFEYLGDQYIGSVFGTYEEQVIADKIFKKYVDLLNRV